MIVGIAGGMCSGKDTVAAILRDAHCFSLINSSDMVRRELQEAGIQISRKSQRDLANERRRANGGDYWVRRAYEYVSEQSQSDRMAIVSLYSVSECRYIQNEIQGKVIGVETTDLQLRFERLVNRADGSRDSLTFEAFLERDAAENSGTEEEDTNIGRVLNLADAIIKNDSDLATLQLLVGETLRRLNFS